MIDRDIGGADSQRAIDVARADTRRRTHSLSSANATASVSRSCFQFVSRKALSAAAAGLSGDDQYHRAMALSWNTCSNHVFDGSHA